MDLGPLGAVDAKGKPLKPIAYKELGLNLPWERFDLAHELTTRASKNLSLIMRAH